MLAHHLVEVVVLVGILFTLGGTALLQQVAQRIVGVGIGEGIDQLRMFDRREFVDALFGDRNDKADKDKQ